MKRYGSTDRWGSGRQGTTDERMDRQTDRQTDRQVWLITIPLRSYWTRGKTVTFIILQTHVYTQKQIYIQRHILTHTPSHTIIHQEWVTKRKVTKRKRKAVVLIREREKEREREREGEVEQENRNR